jgi:hypothetical protein
MQPGRNYLVWATGTLNIENALVDVELEAFDATHKIQLIAISAAGAIYSRQPGSTRSSDAKDYDSRGGSGNGPKCTGRVRVTGPDRYDLDRNGDGVGCDGRDQDAHPLAVIRVDAQASVAPPRC